MIHPKDRTTDFLKPIYHGRNDTTVITGNCTKEDVNQAIQKHDHIIMLGHGTPQGLLAVGQFNGKRPKPMKPSEAIRKGAKGAVTDKDIKDFYKAKPKKDTGVKSYSTYSAGNLPGFWPEDDFGFGNYFDQMSSGYIIDDNTVELLRGKKLTAIWCNADQYMEWNDLPGFYTGMFVSEPAEAAMIGTADTEKWQVEESNYGFVEVVRRFIDRTPEELHNALIKLYGPMADRNAVARYNLKRLYTRAEGASPRLVKVEA